MADKTQSFQNHARWHPPFHFFLAPVSVILLITAIVRLVRFPSIANGFVTLAALAGVVAVFTMRLYALKLQDRLIRLEERLRLSQLLPEPLRSRIGELTEDQLIALRFASDGEVSGLCEKALSGKLHRKEIKQAIVTWKPDYWRV
jgi:hypothetical protein